MHKLRMIAQCPATKRAQQKGFLLISSLIVLGILVIIVGFYLGVIMREVRITTIVNTSPQAYYLAESGVQEAIWKLQNDTSWRTGFETDPNWSATFNRSNTLLPGGSYQVTASNIALANTIITATSTIPVRGGTTQRVVEMNVFKALNTTPIDNIALFSNDEASSLASEVQILSGDTFTNNDLDLNLFSDWDVAGEAKAVDTVDTDFTSDITASAIHDKTRPPVPEPILMPAIDFDSSDPNSYKSRADQVYTTGSFSQLLRNPATLNGITYVTGNIHIQKRENLTINGLLVADGAIYIGNGFSPPGEGPILTINNVNPSQPSGLLAKGDIRIGGYEANIQINGLVYSGDTFQVLDGVVQDVNVSVVGGIIAHDVTFSSVWDPILITLNQEYINTTLGTPLFSPVLIINHWEEEY